MAEYQVQYAQRGFVGISILTENGGANIPTGEDLLDWQSRFGLLDSPLADPGWEAFSRFESPQSENSFALLIAPDMTIVHLRGTYEAAITEDEVEALLPQ